MLEMIRSAVGPRVMAGGIALALVASAVPFAAGPALAAKPVPFVGATGTDCIQAIAGRQEQHVGWFDLGSNKGRWIHIEAEIKVGSGDWVSYVAAGRRPARVETARYEMSRSGDLLLDETTSFRLRIVTRKGVPVPPGWNELQPVDC